MARKKNFLMLAALAAGAYYLFTKSQAPAVVPPVALPAPTGTVPTPTLSGLGFRR